MTMRHRSRLTLALVLVIMLVAGGAVVVRTLVAPAHNRVTAYFDNSNGVYVGDDVMILGVPVGTITEISPEPLRARITFTVDQMYSVPADAKAVILSPTLVTARAIQLTPAFSGGPKMADGAIIPQERTAVPVEFDDLRDQLQRLTDTLQPTEPGGVSTLGEFVNVAAENLRGQGTHIRESLIQVSQVFSTLGDHSRDVFGTVKSLSTLVSALQASTDLMRGLNQNLAAVTYLLNDDPGEIADAVKDLNDVVGQASSFIADNREAIGTTSDRLASVTQALVDSLDDVKQTLHVAPTAFGNFINIYEPAQGALSGVLAANNFSDPISFICGAIQAASRLNMDQSAKLCVQYLAPIVKNRQYNFPPLGVNPAVGAQARPNEVTFSEDWLRPITEAGRVRDFFEGPLPPEPAPTSVDGNVPPQPGAGSAPTQDGPAFGAETVHTDPAAGLPGLMVPQGGGS